MCEVYIQPSAAGKLGRDHVIHPAMEVFGDELVSRAAGGSVCSSMKFILQTVSSQNPSSLDSVSLSGYSRVRKNGFTTK